MEIFVLMGLIQMECEVSEAMIRGICSSSQILQCGVYLALINAVLLDTQFAVPDPETCCLQFRHSNTLLAAETQTNGPPVTTKPQVGDLTLSRLQTPESLSPTLTLSAEL